MVVLCCIVVVTGFLPSPVSRSSLSSPPSQVFFHCLMQDATGTSALGKAHDDEITHCCIFAGGCIKSHGRCHTGRAASYMGCQEEGKEAVERVVLRLVL